MRNLLFIILLAFSLTYSDIEVLTRVIYCEAGEKSDKAKLGVAFVICNIAKIKGKSIAYEASRKNQFCVYSGIMKETDKLKKCQEIAKDAIKGTKSDPTYGATYFFSGSSIPIWAKGKTPCSQIDGLKFYKNIGEYFIG